MNHTRDKVPPMRVEYVRVGRALLPSILPDTPPRKLGPRLGEGYEDDEDARARANLWGPILVRARGAKVCRAEAFEKAAQATEEYVCCSCFHEGCVARRFAAAAIRRLA